MGNFIGFLTSNTAASNITVIFLMILVVLFVVAFRFAIAKKAFRFVAYTPNMLTSIGILGTFTGIVIGLMNFRPDDINGSIESLLAGLQTAFITSLAGMGLSIVFKILSTFSFMQQSPGISDPSMNIDQELLISMQKQNKQLDMLRSAIAGDEESSVAGQLKLSRSDANDHHSVQRKLLEENATALHSIRSTAEQQRQGFQEFAGKLWTQMEAFAEMLSKSATEQVINALKEVISDFNKNLTEQFGENFKALDSSVQKLVSWQEQYRVQLEQMSEQYQQGVQAITLTEASVAHISEESRQIPETMGQLKSVMEVNRHQLDELGRHLYAFKEIRDKAVEAVPEIRQQVDATVTDIKEAAIAASEHHRQLLDASDKFIKEHNQVSRDLLEEYVTKTREGIELVRDNLEQGASAVASGLTESAERVKISIVDGAAEFDDKIQSLSANLISTSDVLSEKSTVISEQLGDTVKDINDHSREMVEKLIEGNKTMTQHLAQGGDEIKNSMEQTVKQISQQSVEIQVQVSSAIEQMQTRLESTLDEVISAQTREMGKFANGVEKAMQTAVDRTAESVNTQLEEIDKGMQQGIKRVMEEMGTALTSITGQFTSDYQKLVRAMRGIVDSGGAT